jgi:hypothetical protein
LADFANNASDIKFAFSPPPLRHCCVIAKQWDIWMKGWRLLKKGRVLNWLPWQPLWDPSLLSKIRLWVEVNFQGSGICVHIRAYRDSPPYVHFGTWKKLCYMKSVFMGLLSQQFPTCTYISKKSW